MRALGWEIGDECYSTVSHTSRSSYGKRIMPGSKGTVIGPCTNTTLSNSDQQVLVEFGNGMRVNLRAKEDLMTDQVHRASLLMLPNTTCLQQ